MTLCSSYSSTVSSARRLILLYDFLSQGEGGKLPFSSAVHMNPSAPVLSTESLIKFFPFFNKYDASYSVLCFYLKNIRLFKIRLCGVIVLESVITANDAVPFQFLLY